MKLHVYFASKFLRNLAGVFAAFLTFLILVDLVDQIRRFDFGVISFRQAFGLALLNAPRLIYNLLPLIVMLATLSLYLSLARTSELVVSRAAGRSALRSLSAPILAALVSRAGNWQDAIYLTATGTLIGLIAAISVKRLDAKRRAAPNPVDMT